MPAEAVCVFATLLAYALTIGLVESFRRPEESRR